MAKKSQTKKASGSGGGGRAGKGDMPSGDMNRPVKAGLMEMPTGGETAAGHEGGGAPKPAGSAAAGGNLMPGEGSGATAAPREGEMPGGRMS